MILVNDRQISAFVDMDFSVTLMKYSVLRTLEFEEKVRPSSKVVHSVTKYYSKSEVKFRFRYQQTMTIVPDKSLTTDMI